MDVLQSLCQQRAVNGILACGLTPFAGSEIFDVAAGHRAKVHLASADSTIKRWVIAPVQGKRFRAFCQGVHNHRLGNLDQGATVLKRAASCFKHPRSTRIVTAHAAFGKDTHGRRVDPRTLFRGDRMQRADQFSCKAFHQDSSLSVSRWACRTPTHCTLRVAGTMTADDAGNAL